MKKLIFTLVILAFVSSVSAQWVKKSNGLPNTTNGCVTALGTNLFLSGVGGVYLSTNNGDNWIPYSNGLPNAIYDIVVIGNTLFAASAHNDASGYVYRSTNNGLNWTQLNSGLTDPQIITIAVKGTDLYVGTYSQGIFKSTNNGDNWNMCLSISPPNARVYGLYVMGNNIFAGTHYYGVWRSTNNGLNWVGINNGISLGYPVFGQFTSFGNYLFAGTRYGGVFRTTNNGDNWNAVNNGLPFTNDITIESKDSTLFVGLQTPLGGVFSSTNNGGNWMRMNDGFDTIPYIGHMTVINNYLFAGTSKGIWRRQLSVPFTDGWVKKSNGLPTNVSSSCFGAIGTNLFLGIYANGVYLSTNNGDNWIPYSNGLPIYINNFAVIGNNLFVSTGNAYVYRSTNNGATWTQVNSGLTDPQVITLAVNGTDLYAGTYDNGIFKTTNNGVNWTNCLITSRVYGLYVMGSNIFAGTHYAGVFRSTNNGLNWVGINNGISFPVFGNFTSIGNNLFAGSRGGGVFRTTNDGNNWNAVNNGLPFTNDITINSKDSTLFVGLNTPLGGVFSSTNNGGNWVTMNDGFDTIPYIGRLFAINNYLFAGTSKGVWRRQSSVPIPTAPVLVSPPNNAINQAPNLLLDWGIVVNAASYKVQIAIDSLFSSMVFDTSNVYCDSLRVRPGLLLANTKYFWRINATNESGTGPWSTVWNFRINPTGAISTVGEIPTEYKLYINHPNPFNPTTNIKFQIKSASEVKLVVFDILGKEIATLVKEKLAQGTYEATFDGSNYSSGIYFYRLTAGDFSETRKMLLLK